MKSNSSIYFFTVLCEVSAKFNLIPWSHRFNKSGNEALALNLARWAFKVKGVLRVGEVAHHLKGEKKPPTSYTVMQQVVRGCRDIVEAKERRMLILLVWHKTFICNEIKISLPKCWFCDTMQIGGVEALKWVCFLWLKCLWNHVWALFTEWGQNLISVFYLKRVTCSWFTLFFYSRTTLWWLRN